jgi:hypothetical protein
MATLYVRSTDGSNADNGSTWALAKATLAGADAIDGANDIIYVSQDHAESTAAAVTWNWFSVGTTGQVTRIICANDGAQPPTALATTATVTTTGSNALIPASTSNGTYMYGIQFIAASGGTGTQGITLGNTAAVNSYERCAFRLASSGAATFIVSSTARAILADCTFKFGATTQFFSFLQQGETRILGGSFEAGTSQPGTIFSIQTFSRLIIDGFDFSNMSSSFNFFTNSNNDFIKVVIRNCKLPAGWSGSLHAGSPGRCSRYEMFNCDGGDTRYRYRCHDNYGSIRDESTIVRSGGANDGSDSFSWKLVSNTLVSFPRNVLQTPELVRWNDTVGSAITVTVDIVQDNLTALTDKEVWLEVMYLGTSGAPLGSFINDAADFVTTAAAQASSSATWTTTGLTNPNKQKLSVTFTPQEEGFIHATVKLGKGSTTVYVDPTLQVS